jgi:hypothetical protein
VFHSLESEAKFVFGKSLVVNSVVVVVVVIVVNVVVVVVVLLLLLLMLVFESLFLFLVLHFLFSDRVLKVDTKHTNIQIISGV